MPHSSVFMRCLVVDSLDTLIMMYILCSRKKKKEPPAVRDDVVARSRLDGV